MSPAIRVLMAGALLVASGAPAYAAGGLSVGKLSFLAKTNVKMFDFSGEAKDVTSTVDRAGTQLKALELRVPVASLTTGMGIRDKHTRTRIFTAADGSTPDIVFKAAGSSCTGTTCEVPGTLSFRGQERPLKLSVTLDGKKVTGSAVVDVVDFGVEPKELKWTHVAVERAVKVDFEVTLP